MDPCVTTMAILLPFMEPMYIIHTNPSFVVKQFVFVHPIYAIP